MHELTGIAFSHYVEKARWALHRFGVPYREHKVLPIFHFAAVYRVHRGKLGRVDRASTRFSTPVLRTSEGLILCDSADIVSYVSKRFAPASARLDDDAQASALEQHFNDRLGPATRLFAYDALFDQPAQLRELVRNNVGWAQSTAFRLAFPVVKVAMSQLLGGLQKAQVVKAIECVHRELEAVSQRMRDGRPFLLGDRFSAADLSFASLAAPALLPAEYSAWLPPLAALPSDVRALVNGWRATESGSFALRLFQEERWRVVARGANPERASSGVTASQPS